MSVQLTLIIDSLLAGSDITALGPDKRVRARLFLTRLWDECPPHLRSAAVPIARRTMGVEGWDAWLKVADVIDFAVARENVFSALAKFPRSKEFDPHAEYLLGAWDMFMSIHQKDD